MEFKRKQVNIKFYPNNVTLFWRKLRFKQNYVQRFGKQSNIVKLYFEFLKNKLMLYLIWKTSR